jgi:hypothetical protein
MEDGIEITEQQFKRMSLKEQNAILFKNIREIKNDMNKASKWSKKAMMVSSAAIGLTLIVLGFLFQHMSQVLK